MHNRKKAALFMVIAALCYATLAAIVKSIEGIPTFEKLFFRTAFGFLFMLAFAWKRRIPLRGVNRVGLVSRGISGFVAALTYYIALAKIPLADTVALTNLYPFIVILLSALFLRERLKWFHGLAFGLSVLGGLLILRPGFSDWNVYSVIALLSAVFTGMNYVILKHVRETDSAEVLVLYYSGISALGCIPFMFMGYFTLPDPFQLMQLVSLGLVGTMYQWFVSAAYKYAPAGEVSIYSYFSIVFSSIMGILLWSEIPGFPAVAGMCLIFAGAYVVFRKEKQNTESLDEKEKDLRYKI